MDCTGLKNVLVIDFDGKLLGQPEAVFSNNEYLGIPL